MKAQYKQIVAFFLELDRQLSSKKPTDLYLIGGAAITLAFDQENRTADLDLIDPPHKLIRLGGADSPLAKKYHVYISPLDPINFSAPDDWQTKCRPLPLDLKNIRVLIPCLEDIVLGKMARMLPKDFEDIISLYEKKQLDPKELLQRLKANKKELRDIRYRNNALLLFKEIFGMQLAFRKGELALRH